MLLRGLLLGLRDVAEGVKVPQDLKERVHLDRARDFTKVILARAVVGLNTVGLLVFDYRTAPQPWLRNGLAVALEIFYLLVILRCLLWFRRRHATGPEARRHINIVSALLFTLGSLWAVQFAVVVPYGTEAQHELLYGIAIGLMATPVLVSPASAAFAFWLPVCVGNCVGQYLNPDFDRFAIVDLLAFIGLTGYCILYLNRRMNERVIGAIRLEENAEVIKLLLRDFEESASDWLWETNAQMELRHVSPRLAEVLHRPAERIVGRFPAALLGEVMDYDHRPGSPVDRLQRLIEERSAFRDLEVPMIIDGEERYWSLTGKPILDKHGQFAGYHGVGSDITAQRRQQEQITFLARHDSLTKLPNRVLFSEVLHEACENAYVQGFALLSLDLDYFKIVNDTLGHATGDGVLVAVGERLRSSVRQMDLTARLGGDEFAALIYTNDRGEAAATAARIIERISRPYHFDGQQVQLGMSVGITMGPQDGTSTGALLKNADLALYRAKNDGRGISRFYDPHMDEQLQGRRALQSALRHALTREEMRLEFQPIVDFRDFRIVGAEALLRWQHPEHGLLPPGEFIPLAEESGLIGQLGEWALGEACREAATWPTDISVAVNLSPLQFRDPALVEIVNQALAASGLAPNRLELEITETTMLDAGHHTTDTLWRLRSRGIRVALDDFGTGYSSLGYLRRFPFDKIKIDRSFVRDLGGEKDDRAIILAITSMAKSLDIIVTAEGVETEEQAALLISLGCGQAQGYLFQRPIGPAPFMRLLGMSRVLDRWQGLAFSGLK